MAGFGREKGTVSLSFVLCLFMCGRRILSLEKKVLGPLVVVLGFLLSLSGLPMTL